VHVADREQYACGAGAGGEVYLVRRHDG
jgi:hypothetical protein